MHLVIVSVAALPEDKEIPEVCQCPKNQAKHVLL
jgi:hypothetical protein